MPGPSYIHYDTTTNIVSGVFTNSKTPNSGEAEVYETHPVFIPPVTSLQWERLGVGSYLLTEVRQYTQIDASFVFGTINVNTNDITHVSWGSLGGLSDIIVPYPIRVVAGSISAAQSRVAGTCEFYGTKNGVIQNQPGAASGLLNASIPTYIFANLDPPVIYDTGDTLSVVAITSGFSPSPQAINVVLGFETL